MATHGMTGSSGGESSHGDMLPTMSASLCGACGMCCDGVLFHSVELQVRDNPRHLASLGLKLRRRKGIEFFRQPCSALRSTQEGCSCGIYEERPTRCRSFICRQLQGVTSATITQSEALAKVVEARRLISAVHELMDQIGETNPRRGLAHRVAHSLTTPERTELHESLEKTMRQLEALLDKDFRLP